MYLDNERDFILSLLSKEKNKILSGVEYWKDAKEGSDHYNILKGYEKELKDINVIIEKTRGL